MKMTFELPADMVRAMKVQAAQEGRKLKDVAEEIFRRGLTLPAPQAVAVMRRVELPLIECRHPASLADELTPERVAELLTEQDVEWQLDASRR